MGGSVFQLLQEPIKRQIEREGIVEASDIQRLAIPPILKGHNVLLIAPTGTGKTLAAVLPILDLYISFKRTEKSSGIGILYVTPLRALNRDLLRRLLESGKDLGINIQVRHGDTPTSVRTKQARTPPDMLITTPETLQAILPGKRMREHLKHVRWVVIDEIHELATDKRGAQLSVGLERLRVLAGRDFQRVGLSATIGEAEKIAEFLAGSAHNVDIIKSTELRGLDAKIESVNPNRSDYEGARKLGIPPAAVGRARTICELVSEERSTLIFTNTREHAEALGSQMNAIGCKSRVKVHHGSLSRELREEVEADFQAGTVKGVICTSSLELGIDVGTVDLVIQYMSPREATRLIQRIGRSGHRIKSLPRGRIIATWTDDILESAILLKHAKNERLERVKIHENALDVLAHQIVGILLERRKIVLDEVYQIIKGAYPFRNLVPEILYDVVKQLQQQRILNLREAVLFPRYPKAHKYYYENLSVIPDVKKYTVFDFVLKRRIGTLDQEFVARRCHAGTEFIMHGNTWRIISVDDEELNVEVEAATPSLSAIPSWEGEMIPVEYDVALEVGKLRGILSQRMAEGDETSNLLKTLFIDQNAGMKIRETLEKHVHDYPLPTGNQIVVERFENCIIIHACFGNLVNETLALIVVTLLQAKLGINIISQVDAYRIALVTPLKLAAQVVGGGLAGLKPIEVATIIMSAVENTEYFAWRHWHIAKRFGVVERKAEYTLRRARMLVQIFHGTPMAEEALREICLEKMDIENTTKVIEGIISGEVRIEIVEQKGMSCSPFAVPMVDKIIPHSLLRPAVPTQPLADIVKERLMSTNMRLICIFNADWESVRAVKTLPEIIRCPKCRSTLIAVVYEGDQELLPIATRKKNHVKLNDEEEKQWRRAWRSASLVQNAGRKAILTMAARGVGPMTAARILRHHVRNEAEFYSEILKAEREYQRTRLFWD